MAESVQERLKLKRTVLDTWSTREKLSLASLVLRSGDQNWSCVSRNIRVFAEPNRPPDWFSPKNCAQQYANLLENVETPKRKKRIAGSNEKSEVETPGESIVRKLKADRVEELKKKMEEIREIYLKVKEASNGIITGQMDDKIPVMLQEIEDEVRKKELEKEAHIKWLKEREERKIELERAWKPGSRLLNIRRASSISEPSSEADSPLSEPLNVDVPEESALTKPTPTSPLLTSLLKSPSTVSQPSSQTSSILHSAITSPHRGSSPTIASLLSSSPGLPGNFVMPPSNVSSNLKNLVSNAIASSFSEDHKVVPTSPSQGAPTLSMLLELPPSLPGKPLPMLKPQPSSPPPYSEHLGPPPPYSQATEYLQKQRAEEAAQIQARAKAKEEEIKVTPAEVSAGSTPLLPFTSPEINVVGCGNSRYQQLNIQNESKGEESQSQNSLLKSSPAKEKDSKRVLHNTSDHDYVETPIKEKEASPVKPEIKTPKKFETDVFEFDELKEGYDKIDLMMKDSKMSYLKSNAQRLALKKEAEATNTKKNEIPTSSPVKTAEPKSYATKDSEKVSSPVKAEVKHEEQQQERDENDDNDDGDDEEEEEEDDEEEEEEKRKDFDSEKVTDEEANETEVKSMKECREIRRTSRNSLDSVEKKDSEVIKRRSSGDDKHSKKEKAGYSSDTCISDLTNSGKNRRSSDDVTEQSEEEKAETEDGYATKDDDIISNLIDITKSDKADLSTTEDEKSNDATPRVYSRRRGGPSFSDSVPNSPAPLTDEEKEYKAWKKAVMLVYTRIAGHKYASLFLKPINDDQAPEYSSIVRRPMDLSTVKRNIELGNIRTTAEFQRDVMLMFVNALMYNERDHHVYKMAKEMQVDSLEHFQMLLRVANENTPLRRETRTQQNPEGKFRTSEKSSAKGSKVTSDLEKGSSSSPDGKHRGRMRNSSAVKLRMSLSGEEKGQPGRKRAFNSFGENLKKKPKVDD